MYLYIFGALGYFSQDRVLDLIESARLSNVCSDVPDTGLTESKVLDLISKSGSLWKIV